MAERTVKFLSIRYAVEEEHPFQINGDGTPLMQLKLKTAQFGEKVDIPRDEDLRRLEHFGAIATEEEQADLDAKADQTALEQLGTEESSGGEDLSGKSAEDLATWIDETKPTVNDMLQAAHDDPDLAERLLDAENLATNNDPRAGVVNGLEKIMADRNQ